MGRRRDDKPARRKRGSGSVWADRYGQNWYSYQDETGKERRHRAVSRDVAERALDEINRAKADGLRVSDGSQSLRDYLQYWLNSEVAPAVMNGELKPATLESYIALIENYVLPTHGALAINAITPIVLNNLRNALRGRVVPQTINAVLSLLSRAFRDAVAWKFIRANPADRESVRRAKSPPHADTAPPTEAQVRALLRAADGHRLAPALHVAATTGIRIGELLGLRWGDIDWAAAELRIARQLQQRRGIDPEGTVTYGSLRLVPPKTQAGQRTIPIPPRLLETLREREREWREEGRMAGWKEHGFVFPSEVGTPMNVRNFETLYYRWRAAAGWPATINFHKLRSLVATLLSESGATDIVQKAILGHGKANVTQRYQKARGPALRAAMGAVERALWGDDESVILRA